MKRIEISEKTSLFGITTWTATDAETKKEIASLWATPGLNWRNEQYLLVSGPSKISKAGGKEEQGANLTPLRRTANALLLRKLAQFVRTTGIRRIKPYLHTSRVMKGILQKRLDSGKLVRKGKFYEIKKRAIQQRKK